jgi:hypothetical protein
MTSAIPVLLPIEPRGADVPGARSTATSLRIDTESQSVFGNRPLDFSEEFDVLNAESSPAGWAPTWLPEVEQTRPRSDRFGGDK